MIEDLRNLVARALAGDDYTPAESARVRAVPDVRTIRYYTTLGLLKPPADMRGRTAYYDETHVMQLVAIKRLQSRDLSLSQIQSQLVGLTKSRLAKIARLPDDFWPAADRYLANRNRQAATGQSEAASPAASRPVGGHETRVDASMAGNPFWLTPAALPTSHADPSAKADAIPAGQTMVRAAIELHLAQGVEVTIHFPSPSIKKPTIDSAALYAAALPLLEELHRQNLIRS